MALTYSNSEILGFLKANPIMNLSFTDGIKPMASVVLFYVEDDFTFYFAAHSTSYKAQALLINPKVSFSVWQHNQMLFQADGSASLLADSDSEIIVKKITDSSVALEKFWPPILRTSGIGYSVFKIKLDWARVLDLVGKNINEKEAPFQDIKLL